MPPRLSFLAAIRPGLTRISLLVCAFLTSAAHAAGVDFGTHFAFIPATICNGVVFLRGPVGYGLVAGMFIWGILNLRAGRGGGVGLIISAAVVGGLLLAAPTIAGFFSTAGQNCLI